MKTIAFLIVTLVAISVAVAETPQSIWAAISSNKPVFLHGKQEVDITFAAINDTKAPVRRAAIRDEGALFINGRELPESGFIFGNGPHTPGEFLAPGESEIFLYRLTEYFKKPGIYEVIWRGKDFQTKPIVFRLVESK